MDEVMDLKKFDVPPREYRAKPFWALNGKLEEKNLEFQIKCMKKMGFGGAFLHSRTGLETEYMSDEWLKMLGFAVEKLKENGLEAWLYDEDRWPSGTCGGYVTKTKEFRAKYMSYRIIDGLSDNLPDNSIGIFSVIKDGRGAVKSFKRVKNIKENNDGQLYVFYWDYMLGDSFYNGYTYADTMYKPATEEFIKLTHEKYKKVMGSKFGSEIIGIFTDEPNRGPFLNGFSRKEENKEREIPYTFNLFEEFYKRKGYRLEERLPLIWFGVSESEFCKETYDLIEVEQELFIENFAVPYQEWCRKNKLLVTGHILHEDNLAAQATMCGSVMRYYEFMDYPGVDNLLEENYAYNVPKLVSSVARQLGKKFVLDEIYGATGWKMSFANYKHTGDWQSFGGITLRCPHLSWYTMKGEAKRDYPASILNQSPWYKDYSAVEDYFARLSYIFSEGENCVDTVIINPVESVWGLINERALKNCFQAVGKTFSEIEKKYYELYKYLLLNADESDYADEDILARYGNIKNGELEIGKATYKNVIICGNINLRSSTEKILKEFTDCGGKLIVVEREPDYIDGIKGCWNISSDKYILTDYNLEKIGGLIKNSEVEVGENIIYTKRRFKNSSVYCFLNAKKCNSVYSEIRIKTDLSPLEMNIRDGKIYNVSYQRKGGFICIDKNFAPDEELFLLFAEENIVALTKNIAKTETPVSIPDRFEYGLSDNNYLVMDNAVYYIDGVLQGKDYILDIDKKIRAKFGLEQRHGEMIQPWYKRKFYPKSNKIICKITLKYVFAVDCIPEKIAVMGENFDISEIFINGEKLCNDNLSNTEIDNCFKLLSVPFGIINKGKNELEISFDFFENFGIEGCFLVGNFGVCDDVVSTLPNTLKFGDFCKQGLPYYRGSVSIKIPLADGKYVLKQKVLDCALEKINGEIIAFQPFEKQFSVEGGIATLEIVSTANNLFGVADENGNHSKFIFFGLRDCEIYKI